MKDDELNRVNDSMSKQKNENTLLKQKVKVLADEDEANQRKIKTQGDGHMKGKVARIEKEDKRGLNAINDSSVHINSHICKKCDRHVEKETKTVCVQTNSGIMETYDKLSAEHKSLDKKLAVTQNNLQKKTQDYAKINGEYKTLQQQANILREHEGTMRDLLEEREITIHDNEAKINKMMEEHSPFPDITITIQNLVNEGFNKIEKNIDQLITRKLADNSKEVQGMDAKIQEVLQHNKTYANSVTKGLTNENLTTALKTTKNEDLVEANEREKRCDNLIIYGVSEAGEGDLKQRDEQFVASFLDTIGLQLRPKQIIRLGRPNEDKKRPVKLIMNNTDDKEQVQSRLSNLKDADDVYRNISVRDDYTIRERELIREFAVQAKQKNELENTDVWKVRGTPKNGLRLVKITKRR